ncbi:hypothetical protein SAMN04490182_3183 [Pseudomonas cedrina]|uniref:DUF2218 domain-containing protein n=2 Tax=Pseudomonas cedrina TaxID=651740 RepID=A0A1V2JXG4_PSECE|nr:DUF2218 domain-containing protein [Pseudomonas cedrina]ONH49844.1 hypothetical protein BLL36_28020 [Pseudomonas cedrina subsp. cedrina]SDT06556.1 hypothetical protein SAMN04490182_3183 [Pseudomonas cedrina]
MLMSRAQVSTPLATRCLTRLCRHWSHKFAVSFDEKKGDIFFDPSRCLLEINEDGLLFTLHAPDLAQLDELEPVVADHLQRMAGEDPLVISWQR